MATKHAPTCKMAYGRKDPSCPRCQELLAGAEPRRWASKYKGPSAEDIKKHDCKTAGCGPVCTFGEW